MVEHRIHTGVECLTDNELMKFLKSQVRPFNDIPEDREFFSRIAAHCISCPSCHFWVEAFKKISKEMFTQAIESELFRES